MSKTVFWSWQSDLPAATTKNFIKEALAQALKKLAEELELETADRLELDHDTKGEPGLVDIVSTIFRKIDDCQIFVADITPITEITTETGTKKIPNPNVMIELGYAIREAGPQRVITVTNLAFGGKPEELPFDLRHRRGAITYRLDSAKDPAIEKIRKCLVKKLVTALKTNLAVPREEQLIRNPMPALSVVAAKDSPKVWVIQQKVQLNDVPSLADIMARTPLRTKEQQKDPLPLVEDFQPFSMYMFQPEHIKPFREWTEEELGMYNKRVQGYYDRYQTYLEQIKEHRLRQQRTVSIRLAVQNLGTRPATDVRAKITFPDGILIYEDDDLPRAPHQPTPPSLGPNKINDIRISSLNTPFLERPSHIADDHKSIMFKRNKIQHGLETFITSFKIVMSTQADIRSFEVSYQIAADELPRQITGNLCFEVQQAE